MRTKKWLLFFLSLLLLVMIVFREGLGWRIRSFFEGEKEKRSTDELLFENQSLKAKLESLEFVAKQLPAASGQLKPALVYSRYPFNLKNEIVVNAGVGDEIKSDQAVFYGFDVDLNKSLLIGRVAQVFEDKSLVVTIFDTLWKSEVRIGSDGAEAVLEGGLVPRLKFIEKNAHINPGSVVYNSDERFPHSAPIGRMGVAEFSSDHLFQEADLEIDYDLSEIGSVLILK